MNIVTKFVFGVILFTMLVNLLTVPSAKTIIFYNKTPTTLLNNTSTNATALYTAIGSTYNLSTSGGIYEGDQISLTTILSGFLDLKKSIDIGTTLVTDTSRLYIDPLFPGFSYFIARNLQMIIVVLASISLMLVFFGRQAV